MDNAIALLSSQLAEEEMADDDLLVIVSLLIRLLLGAEVHRQIRAHRCSQSRHNLTRPLLLPDPCVNTPWRRLLESQADSGFITTMGFDVATFYYVLESGFRHQWNTSSIRRADGKPGAKPRLGQRSLDAEGALGLVLHYLSSTMSETSLQEIFALIPSTVSRYLDFGIAILLCVLRSLPEAAIAWPKAEKFAELNALIVRRHPLLTGAFASIDGLNLPVQTLGNEDIENSTYNGWLRAHFVSSVLVFSPEGKLPLPSFSYRH